MSPPAALSKFAETFVAVPGGRMYVRHSELDCGRPVLLLVHGLGESSLCFMEAFAEPLLRRYTIVAPDLLGYGRSDAAADEDYSFDKHARRLIALLDVLTREPTYLLGHSMGGGIATVLCTIAPARVAAFVNLEGDIDASDRFISNAAVLADREGRFEDWLRRVLPATVLGWAADWSSAGRYAASLAVARTEAFRQGVHEIYRLNETVPGGSVGAIGEMYRELEVPRVFCWREGFPEPPRQFLDAQGLASQGFDATGHWIMLDRPEAFYAFVAGFFLAARSAGNLIRRTSAV